MPIHTIDQSSNNRPIVFSGGDAEDEDVYCSKCGLKLIPFSQGKLLCTDCDKLFNSEGILLHHQSFGPTEDKQNNNAGGPDLVPMKEYTNKSKKKATWVDRDDEALQKPGRVWISEETYWPVDDGEH